MIPDGYITLPEALEVILACIDDDDMSMQMGDVHDKEAWRRAAAEGALRDAVLDNTFDGVSLYVMRGGRPEFVSISTARMLIDEGWRNWVWQGRVRKFNIPRVAHLVPAVAPASLLLATRKFNGCRLLVKRRDVQLRWKRVPDEPVKTSGPGRPPLTDAAMAKFNRRRLNNLCEETRSAETRALLAWCKKTDPTGRQPTYKTIYNKLPGGFPVCPKL